jgi:acyl transferase domain-containing protein
MEWKRDPTKPRIAGVSSFGITGTDAHAIVQETPWTLNHPTLLKSALDKSRPVHVLTLAGKNEEALEDNLKQFKDFLETTSEK